MKVELIFVTVFGDHGYMLSAVDSVEKFEKIENRIKQHAQNKYKPLGQYNTSSYLSGCKPVCGIGRLIEDGIDAFL